MAMQNNFDATNSIQIDLRNYRHGYIAQKISEMVDGSDLTFVSNSYSTIGNYFVTITCKGDVWISGKFQDKKAFDAANTVLGGLLSFTKEGRSILSGK